ncbi:MAG: hypothetical protein R3B36_00315 [Polyangiaceae bacterium]
MRKYLGWITLAALCACSSGGGATPPAPGADAGTPEADAGPDPVVGRPGRGITLSVVDAGSPAFVLQGKTLDVKLKLERQIASAGAVTVTVKGLPKDATSAGVVIPAGALEGTLTIQSAAATPQGPSDVVLEAAESDGSLASAKLPLFVRGAPGTLDTTFAKAGVYSPFFGNLLAGALLSDAILVGDGKTVVAGRHFNTVAVGKLTPEGALDTTFAGGGIQDVAVKQGELRVVVQPATSAKKDYLTVLQIGPSPSILMLKPDGQPDTTFDSNGTRAIDVGPAGVTLGTDVAVLANGKILALTSYSALPGGKGLGVSRWNLDGSLDTTYGANPPGLCSITVDGTGGTALNGGVMLPSTDGSVRVVASAVGTSKSIIKGCTATGALDTTLGAAPDHVWDLGSSVVDATREADGTTTILGTTTWSRFNAAGVADQSIGNLGKVTVATTAQLTAIRVQADKKVLVAGFEANAFKLFRFLPTGSLDPSFGAAGVLSVDVAPDNTAELKRLTLLPDDRALLVGTRNDLPDGAVVRLWR